MSESDTLDPLEHLRCRTPTTDGSTKDVEIVGRVIVNTRRMDGTMVPASVNESIEV